MREFKFRAWDKIVNKMFIPTMINQFGDVRHTYEGGETWLLKATDSFDLMLFAGQKDKNGKDIFQGDLCKMDDEKHIFVISWNDKFASFCISRKGWMFNHYFGESCVSGDIEIIGNIYENPQLLTNE